MATKTFLVTAATGTVGRPLTHKLLAMGHKVHALTSNPGSERALALARAGATLFRADLDDKAAIGAAATSCSGVFLNPMPANIANHFFEATYAQNVIDASRAAGVRTCVYHSVENTDCITDLPEWDEWISTAGIVAQYWTMKTTIQHAVRTAGFDSWTAVQSGFHMSNFGLRYLAMMFPGARDTPTGTFSFPIQPSTPLHLVDPADVAELAARALNDPHQFSGLEFNAVGEELTLARIAEIVAKYSGRPMQAHHPNPSDVIAKRSTELSSGNGLVLDIFGQRPNLSKARSFGVEFSTFDQYIKERQTEIRQALG